MTRSINVLLIEDSDDDALLITRRIKRAGYILNSMRVDNREDMMQALQDQTWDLALCDHSMPHFSHMAALDVIGQLGIDLPLVIVSGAIDEKTATSAMKSGARDYVMKDNLDRLIPVIERELFSKEVRAEKRNAETALSLQVQFLNELIQTIPAGIFFKEIDGQYRGCNTLFAQFVGKQNREEIIGRSTFDLMPAKEAHQHTEMDQYLLKHGGQTSYEASLADPQGIQRHFMVHKAVYRDQRGEPAGVVGVLLDISALKEAEEKRKELESQLRQAQKLEAIGTLAGGIAHDFNNILAAIVGYCELAISQRANQEKVSDFLKQVLAASDRAKNLTKQILTFSRRADQEVRPVNPGLIVKEALKLLRASLPPSIEITVDIDNNAGLVSADPTNIHQIVMNLCTNAAHAMKTNGGKLRVELHRTGQQEGEPINNSPLEMTDYLVLRVTDTGHGMTGATIERIFDPYFTTKGVGEGTGLGLSVVHGIVTAMGGKIEVQSELGQGTVFSILLPAANETTEVHAESASVSPKGSESILLVDDEPSITEVLSRQLQRLGYQVSAFHSGDEAWQAFAGNPGQFEAIITDLLMPGMQGNELVKRIKNINPNLTAIVYTGYGECLTNEEKNPEAADAICFKPMHALDIVVKLRELLDRSPAR